MAGIIDTLIVSLKLDPKDFKKGADDAKSALGKVRTSAVEEGKKVESAAAGMADGISTVTRRLLALYAAFAGARSFTGFIDNLITTNAQLGRFSENLGLQTQYVSGWQMAVERVGGSAAQAQATIAGLTNRLTAFRTMGTPMPVELATLAARSGVNIDYTADPKAFVNQVSKAIKTLARTDPSQAKYLAGSVGIDDSSYNLMAQYGGGFNAYVEGIGAENAPSQKAIEASKRLQDSIASLHQTFQALGNTLLTTLGPTLENIVKAMTDWVDQNQEWLKTEITEKAKQFVEAIQNVDWSQIGTNISEIVTVAKELADSIGSVSTAVEALFALWVGSKFIAAISNMRGMAGALGLGGGVASAGMLGVGVGVAAMLYPSELGADDVFSGNDDPKLKGLKDAWASGRMNVSTLSTEQQKANAAESYQFWISQGLSPAAALALVANEQGESSFDPRATGDNGAAVGIFQWHKDRRDKIFRETGIDISNPNTSHLDQLKAAHFEMSLGLDAGAGRAWRKLKVAKDRESAMQTLIQDFERPADQPAEMYRRLGLTNQWGHLAGMDFAPSVSAGAMVGGPTSNSTSTTTVGTLIVNSASSNAAGIASDIRGHLENLTYASQAETGSY